MKTQRNIFIATTIIFALLSGYLYLKKNPDPCPEIVKTITTTDTSKGTVDKYVPVPVQQKESAYVPKPKFPVNNFTQPAKSKITMTVPEASGSDFIFTNPTEWVIPKKPSDYFANEESITSYEDTLRFIKGKDTLGYAVVVDDIKDNLISNRSFSWEIYNRTTTNNLLVKNYNKYYWGLEAMGNQTIPFRYFGANIAAQFKRKANKPERIYVIGGGLMNEQFFYKAQVLFQIKSKR